MKRDAREDLPTVSIVTPSFNQGDFIRETIESVLAQTYDRLEYIVVDGGSEDQTVDILKEYDGRIHWVSEPDQGQSDAINKGWRNSTGEIITWLNSDDLLAGPRVVERVEHAFTTRPDVDILYGDFEVVGVRGEHLFTRKQAPFHRHVLLFANNFIVPSAFCRRRILEEVGYLDVDLPWVMDLDFWLRALDAGATFQMLPEPMWKHRFHPQSNTVGGRSEMVREFREIQGRHQPAWFQSSGIGPRIVRRAYAGLLRLFDQLQKLLFRAHVDNLIYSWYVRRTYSG